MRNTDVPAQVQGGGILGDMLNRLRKCLMRRTIIAGPGIILKETNDGIIVTVAQPTGPIIWAKVCLDGEECYLPVRAAGLPHRSVGAADYEAAEIVEEDIPAGSIVLE